MFVFVSIEMPRRPPHRGELLGTLAGLPDDAVGGGGHTHTEILPSRWRPQLQASAGAAHTSPDVAFDVITVGDDFWGNRHCNTIDKSMAAGSLARPCREHAASGQALPSTRLPLAKKLRNGGQLLGNAVPRSQRPSARRAEVPAVIGKVMPSDRLPVASPCLVMSVHPLQRIAVEPAAVGKALPGDHLTSARPCQWLPAPWHCLAKMPSALAGKAVPKNQRPSIDEALIWAVGPAGKPCQAARHGQGNGNGGRRLGNASPRRSRPPSQTCGRAWPRDRLGLARSCQGTLAPWQKERATQCKAVPRASGRSALPCLRRPAPL